MFIGFMEDGWLIFGWCNLLLLFDMWILAGNLSIFGFQKLCISFHHSFFYLSILYQLWNIYLSCIVNISIAFDFGFYNWIVWFYIQILLIMKINRHPKTYDCVDFDTFHQNPKIGKRFAFDGKIFEIFVMLILNHFWLKPQCNIELYDVIICRHWNWSLLKIFVSHLSHPFYWSVYELFGYVVIMCLVVNFVSEICNWLFVDILK